MGKRKRKNGLGTADVMPVVNPGKPKGRVTSGSDERGVTMPPRTEDRMPSVPMVRARKRG